MTPVSPGKVHATLNIRTHQADVDVDFTTMKYSITYVSSKNLLSQGARIHKAYNQWVRELETGINTGLYEASVKKRPNTTTNARNDASTAWFSIQNSTDPKVFLNYIERYPDSEYVPLARAKLAALLDAPKKTVEFDPSGSWDVSASYRAESTNTSSCLRNANWNFTLTLSKGKISETFYSGRSPLFVSGFFDDEELSLLFTAPAGGSQWKWTEKFKLDRNEKRLTETSGAGGTSGCLGTIDVYMKKRNAVNAPLAKAPTTNPLEDSWQAANDSQNEQKLRSFLKSYSDSKYAPLAIEQLNKLLNKSVALPQNVANSIGRWSIDVTYKGGHGNAAYCPNGEKWKFVFEINGGKQTKEVWSGRNALYVTSERINDNIVLAVDVPRGGEAWEWTEPFRLDQKEKHFLAEAKGQGGVYGGCSGKLYVLMTKLN